MNFLNNSHFIVSFSDYLGTLAVPLRDSIVGLPALVPDSDEANGSYSSVFEKLVCHIIRMAHLAADYVLQAKATSNTSPNIELGEREYFLSVFNT